MRRQTQILAELPPFAAAAARADDELSLEAVEHSPQRHDLSQPGTVTSPGPQASNADTRTSWPDPTARETVLSGPIRNRSHPCLTLVTQVTCA